MMARLQIFLVCMLFCLLNGVNASEATGTAQIINGDIKAARDTAYERALAKLSTQSGVRVKSTATFSTEQGYSESTQVSSGNQLNDVELIDERIEGDRVYIRLRAGQASATAMCENDQYRKKLAVVYFPLEKPQDIGYHDYHGFEQQIPIAFSRYLNENGPFLSLDSHNRNIYESAMAAPQVVKTDLYQNKTILDDMAREQHVQFVIAGVIRDLSLNAVNPYNILEDYLGYMKPKARNLVIEFFVYDALTGELIARNLHQALVEAGDVLPATQVPVSSQQFTMSSIGQKFAEIYAVQLNEIKTLLSCRPFITKIIKAENDKVYLDAGIASGLSVGDTLTVYRPDIEGSTYLINDPRGQYGYSQTTAMITKVFPAYAVAKVNKPDPAVNLEGMHAY